MTFFSYITRPSGFGRTRWGLWATAVAIMIYGAGLVFIDFDPTTAIVVFTCFGLTFGIFLGGTIKNYREDKKGLPTNPDNHMNEIEHEGKEFPIMKVPFGAPITDKVLWYAARYECSIADAKTRIAYAETVNGGVIIEEDFQRYLSDKRFDKFLRK